MSVSLVTKGREFVRSAIAISLSKDNADAKSIAALRWGEQSAAALYTKAAVSAGATGAWGSDLTTPSTMQEFFALVLQQSILGRLSGKAEMPLNVRTLAIVNGATAHWVAQGKPKPISKMQLAGDTLEPLKTAAIVVLSKEVVQNSSPQTESRINADLQRACVELLDQTFIDPDNAGIAGLSPASITNGTTPIASSGNPATDIAALIENFTGDLAASYFIADPTTATQLALARDATGGFCFPDCGPRGGSILGIPLLTSRSSPRDSSGGILVLLDATAVGYGVEGIRIARSEHATLQMSDTPDDPADATTVMISLWQNDLVAFLVEISANFKLAQAGGVAVITGAAYSTEVQS